VALAGSSASIRANVEGEDEPPGFGHQPQAGQDGDTAHAAGQGQQVARGAAADGGKQDRAEELDRADRREREPVHSQVEQRVHHGQDGAQAREDPALVGGRGTQHPPGPAPGREHDRRRRDPQPRHAQDVDPREQQHRERRPEVVEDRTDQEVRRGREPLHHGPSVDLDRHPAMVVGRWPSRQGPVMVKGPYCLGIGGG
jgi:hypothetical protein